MYCIVSAGSGNIGFNALAGYCLDGALVGRGWDGRTLAPAGTGAPPLALEGWKCAGWLLPGWDEWEGWTGWGVGGTGVGGRTLAPAGTGAPPWSPEQGRHRWL